MADEKKPGGLLIALGMGKKPMSKGEPDEGEGGGEDEMKRSAVSDLIDAIHGKDVDGACSALDDWFKLTDKDEGDEGEGEEEPEG